MIAKIKKHKIVTVTILICILLFVACWLFYHHFIMGFIPEELENIDARRAQILYKTDHRELLKECRKIISMYRNEFEQSSKEKTKSENVIEGPGQIFHSSIRIKNMRILGLDTTWVDIYENFIVIEMGVSFYPVNVNAYAEGVRGQGDMKLLDGLWYNDKGFSQASNFRLYLEDLKSK